ncbi:uncharacterized protein KY384_008944 [Bacidia gigantensis]|uniref:uncharacterized protein n=1 Tax=Bacidia gigantensis TaxID=2732470 RepID=UPI001D055EDA|nr:uncharacterized protein KY384_008944 [Bacidia gigantensis]KAG8525300.1 hypothetical protein KY384_008944 [Bacidia gigantensis]
MEISQQFSSLYHSHCLTPSPLPFGRLQGPILSLLEGSDIQFRREHRLDIALVKNLPIALVFLPADAIPYYVAEGEVDLGITGLDQVREEEAGKRRKWSKYAGRREGIREIKEGEVEAGREGDGGVGNEEAGVDVVMDLGFGQCKLQVQVPESRRLKTVKDLIGGKVVTSFKNLTKEYLRDIEGVDGKGELKTQVIYQSGSVEAACSLGAADGIVDLVESGETMRAAGLIPIDTVLSSYAVFIKSKRVSDPALANLIASRIKGVITAQKYILCQYNIPRSLLAKASQITPGKRAPTITALDDAEWVAVSSMVEKNKIAVVMDELTSVGATDILCLGILNSRTT